MDNVINFAADRMNFVFFAVIVGSLLSLFVFAGFEARRVYQVRRKKIRRARPEVRRRYRQLRRRAIKKRLAKVIREKQAALVNLWRQRERWRKWG